MSGKTKPGLMECKKCWPSLCSCKGSGGRRKGAGRKPSPPRVAVTVRITPKAADKLNAYVAAKQSSQAREIESWALRLRVPAVPNDQSLATAGAGLPQP